VQAFIEEASRFRGPVYLFDGDSHLYNTDYLRVTVGGPGEPLLRWEKVPYAP
jgi:hypothetical protein